MHNLFGTMAFLSGSCLGMIWRSTHTYRVLVRSTSREAALLHLVVRYIVPHRQTGGIARWNRSTQLLLRPIHSGMVRNEGARSLRHVPRQEDFGSFICSRSHEMCRVAKPKRFQSQSILSKSSHSHPPSYISSIRKRHFYPIRDLCIIYFFNHLSSLCAFIIHGRFDWCNWSFFIIWVMSTKNENCSVTCFFWLIDWFILIHSVYLWHQ